MIIRRMSASLPLILGLVLAGPASAQETKGAAKDKESGWLPILKEHAAAYEITPQGETTTGGPVRPLPEPLLRWTQPVRGGDDGAVFLWVADGRPMLIGTVFTYRSPNSLRALQHEVHSLAPTGLDVVRKGRKLWHPSRPGLTFRAVPDAPAPVDSAPARLRQMQAIARDVSAESLHETAGKNELRLMPRPLHRYGSAAAGMPTDGALFCFAHGTDPELFLILEARRAGEAMRWEYALARFSDLELHARYKGRTIYDAPRGIMNDPDNVHSYFVVEQVDADTPEEYRKALGTP